MLGPALSVLSAVLLVLLYPRFQFAWLAPVALTPLLVAIAREPKPSRRLLMGEAAGFVYWFGVCYWIQFVLEEHGGMGSAGSWLVFFLFCIAKAVHLGVFAWLAGPLLGRWYAAPLVAALWTGIERTHAPLGFAWLALGNAGVNMGLPMRLAPIIGVYGLSFVFALMAACVALAVLRRPRHHLLWVLLLPLLYLLPGLPEAGAGRESAVALQPNISMNAAWSEEGRKTLYTRLAYRTLRSALAAGEPPPALMIWPESPGPFYYPADPVFRAEVANLARLAGAPFLFGAVAHSPAGAPLNAAQMLGPDGSETDRYDKMFLVPFGEFVPAPFGFVNRITKEAGDFEPGTRLVVFPAGARRLGVFICYESAFPHLVRQFALSGAGLLVNISNDGYFGPSAARLQHLSLARMRAAENRRWLLRPTNDGVTAAIDPAGRVRESFPPFRETAGRLPFNWVTAQTPYTRYGDWFAWSCLVAGVAAGAAPFLLPRLRRAGSLS